MTLTLNKGFWSPAAGGGSDPYFDDVTVLLGSSGSGSTFTDLSSNSTTFTLLGDPAWSASQTKFGSQAIHFDGNDALRFADATTEFNADWTLEFWVYPSTWSSDNIFCKSAAYQGVEVSSNSGGTTSDYIIYGGDGSSWTGIENTSVTLATGSWQYSAISYKDSTNTMTVWLGTSGNATQLASGTIGGGLVDTSAFNFIGCNRGTTFFMDGYLQEFRWTQGVCRYQAGDTVAVPTSEFPRS